jgi:DNA polymerase-3 subunit epsilon
MEVSFKGVSKYFKKVIAPTDKEFKLHNDYLKNSLKKNFFN